MKLLYLIFIVTIVCFSIVFISCKTSVTKNLDSYIYELPYKSGDKHKVVQGYGGGFSHKDKAALDFEMDEGTAVYAARGGLIYAWKDDSNKGGIFTETNKANFIIIRHNDGSFGCYWHLKQHGVIRKQGNVDQGELIGYSGKTGYTLRAHLHFAVKLKLNYSKDFYTRTKFRTAKGISLLKQGESYQRP
jgi:murein DD-endopeptidase MepM/ murein hydrolase activator NlpD